MIVYYFTSEITSQSMVDKHLVIPGKRSSLENEVYINVGKWLLKSHELNLFLSILSSPATRTQHL